MNRYNRQIILPGFGKEAQQKLADAKVLVIGAGGLGCPVITYLASAGVGEIAILDFDKIDETNLARQPIYTSADIGKPKAEVAAEFAKKLNENIKIEALPYKLTPKNAWPSGRQASEVIKNYDLIIDSSDNFETRYLINDVCVQLEKPWVFGAIEEWQGQVSVFNFEIEKGIRSATYRCVFPEAPEDAPNCAEIGVIATLPAVVGSIMANEAIKCLTAVGEPLANKFLYIDLLNNTYETVSISRNEQVADSQQFLENTIYAQDVSLSVEEYKKAAGKYILVDIRETFEWEEDPAAETNIPYHELLSKPGQLLPENHYILLCDQGKRSLILAKHLRNKAGIQNVSSLEGGIVALQNDDLQRIT